MDCLGKIYAILEDLDNSCMIITSDFNANISKSDSFNGNNNIEMRNQHQSKSSVNFRHGLMAAILLVNQSAWRRRTHQTGKQFG